ncbi:DUF4124 domain-containing protein [Pleionea mediterranea]|uniref:Uncharacterized protein DUF4124 n=1 Tax=Pleionea mediterranea TaxID=523701 RepID=A0A316FG48_9GAMM|nr:DUF4124 domain-containing protein [Pleionea mediterranea]PWK47878.1 uncharacterized protein DUF4124 [Pleionea mediterranea]
MKTKFIKYLALIFILINVSTSSFSGKIYRWVDESGKVHYSDKPHKGAVEKKVKVNSRSFRTSATVSNGVSKCGTIKLRKYEYNGQTSYREVRRRISRLQEEVKRESSKNVYGNNVDEKIKRINNRKAILADHRCAINWYQKIMSHRDVDLKKVNHKVNEINQKLIEINVKEFALCGNRPFKSKSVINGDEYKILRNWERCQKEFKSKKFRLENLRKHLKKKIKNDF